VAGHLISIVDDDPSMRDALAGLIRSFGYDVRTFASAEEFLASHELIEFACAITDIQMPGMNGFQLKHELNLRLSAVPVIMITARSEPQLEAQARSSGAASFLRKPFEADALAGCIEDALQGRASFGNHPHA
jgi:FixJ family two-component response regulator